MKLEPNTNVQVSVLEFHRVTRRMELSRRSFTGKKWKSEADHVEYGKLCQESFMDRKGSNEQK
jgi:ribosomal protein S1